MRSGMAGGERCRQQSFVVPALSEDVFLSLDVVGKRGDGVDLIEGLCHDSVCERLFLRVKKVGVEVS